MCSYRSPLAVAGREPIRSIPIRSQVAVIGIGLSAETDFWNLGFVYNYVH